jgi:hypothetical protein
LRVAQGEPVEGFEDWRLQLVRADRVVLRKNNGEMRELVLVRPPAPPQPATPADAAQPEATPGQGAPPQAGPGGAIPLQGAPPPPDPQPGS